MRRWPFRVPPVAVEIYVYAEFPRMTAKPHEDADMMQATYGCGGLAGRPFCVARSGLGYIVTAIRARPAIKTMEAYFFPLNAKASDVERAVWTFIDHTYGLGARTWRGRVEIYRMGERGYRWVRRWYEHVGYNPREDVTYRPLHCEVEVRLPPPVANRGSLYADIYRIAMRYNALTWPLRALGAFCLENRVS